ncbi:MAG: MOSC domain-containing protein [Xanthobacteraceae bacterium]
MTQATIRSIYRYPVKGLSAQELPRVNLATGETLPLDRAYAIANGFDDFDPANPIFVPKQRFLMLMKNERLAGLDTRFDAATQTLSIVANGEEAARGDLRTHEGRGAIEAFFRRYCANELRGPLEVMHAENFSFADAVGKFVSIINLASVAAIEDLVGAPVDPLRFRGNVYVSGSWPAWHEFNLVGQTVAIGENVRLRVNRRIERCAATNVEPFTGIRDLNIPRALYQRFGHADCGIYAEVVAPGEIAVGDTVRGEAV